MDTTGSATTITWAKLTGSGTFVSDPKLRRGDAADINMLAERIDTLITRGLNLGIDAQELTRLFESRLTKFSGESSERKEDNE